MSRKLALFIFSLFLVTTASAQPTALPDLVRQANQLKGLDPSCPDPKAPKTSAPATCESSALFVCGFSEPATRKPELAVIRKKYETALSAYFRKAGPAEMLSAIRALGTPVDACDSLATGSKMSADSACGKALIAALAEKFARTRTYAPTGRKLASDETAATTLDFGSLEKLLSDEALQKFLREANT